MTKLSQMIAAILLSVLQAAVAAPVLLIDGNGELLGADDLIVNGDAYNVRFVTGSCASSYSGCDQLSDLPFKNLADASAAGNALLDEVFTDSSLGMFDRYPDLTANCGFAFQCNAAIPYALPGAGQVSFLFASNGLNQSDFLANSTPNSATTDYFGGRSNVLAHFTRAVPEPSTLLLALLVLPLLGLARHRYPYIRA